LKIRTQTHVDESRDETNDRGDDQVFQSMLDSRDVTAVLVVGSTARDAVCAVVRSPARHWIARAATRLRVCRAPVETAGWKAAPMDCLFQNARDLLRERSMFGSRPATK